MSTRTALSLQNASKTFGPVRVLNGVDLTIRAGEIHALLGENGSGKSTLVKILAGFYTPDPGTKLNVGGRVMALPVSTDDVHHSGVRFVHQELALLPEASVLENLLITGYGRPDYLRIDWSAERDKARGLLDRFGLTNVAVDAPVNRLSAADRAMVAIARASGAGDGGVLVVDEATAYLPADGAERVLEAVAAARDQGAGVLMITHKLDEVFALSDEVTVLRDGVVVRNERTANLTRDDVVSAMLGERSESATFAEAGQRSTPHEELALAVQSLSVREVRDLSLDVRAGEIVGITGLRGSGIERVPYALVGAVRAAGSVAVGDGPRVDLGRFSPRQAVDAGLALVPGDREKDGGAEGVTMWENMALASMLKSKRRWFLRPAKERERVEQMMQELDVRPLRSGLAYERFSGGNRRKALLGKWLLSKPRVLLLDEPTEGVDIGAKKAILDLLQRLAADGISVLIASTEYEDLARICHRVFVARPDRPVTELTGASMDSYAIREACYAS
jgi:ribose transport system ATP-binding protein